MQQRHRVMRRCAAAGATGVAMLCLALLLGAQGQETFKTQLSALPADARTRPSMAGTGSVSAVLSGSKLTVTGSFSGLLSPATTANLHSAVAAGVRGPVVGDLTITQATSGTISGTFELTAPQLAEARKGGLYVQIQSEKTPDGVLWGWLLH